MANWTAYSYLRFDSIGKYPWKASGVLAVNSTGTFGGTPKPPWTGGGTLEVEGAAQGHPAGLNVYLLHTTRQMYNITPAYVDVDTGLNVPTVVHSTRMVHGMGGRNVPWGVLIGIAEAEEGDVRTWTCTYGANAGKTVGMAIENPRTTVVLQAIFLTGSPPPQRGSIFFYTKADGTVARCICLKKSWLWSQGGWLALQIDATAWDGAMSRIR